MSVYVVLGHHLTPHQNYEARVVGVYSELGLACAVADHVELEPTAGVVVYRWRLDSLDPTGADAETMYQRGL